MLGSFLPKEGRFFELFGEIGEEIVKATQEFAKMVEEPERADHYCHSIKAIEHRGDEITHATMDLLHKTFITPLDRNDIHALITKLDDILDFIDAASQRVSLYEIRQFTSEAKQLSRVCTQSAELVRTAVSSLNNLKHPDKLSEVCVEINRLENEADQILRSAIAKLFKEEPDVRTLIKLKEIYELLETMTDRCEDAANIIEGIVLEYA